MKKMIVLLALALGLVASAQTEDGLFYDEDKDILTLVVDGNELQANLSTINSEDGYIIVSTHYVYLLDSSDNLVEVAKLGSLTDQAPPPLTGNLEVDSKNLEIDKQKRFFDFDDNDFKDYSREKLFEIKGLPVYSSGLNLND